MNFATLKGLGIPEGNVTKITDALGNVLWSAVKMVNLTITSFWDGMDGDTARITINSPSPFAPNPNEPNNKVTSWTAYVYDLLDQQNRTIKIPVGSTIECYITRDKGNADSHITLNDVKMVTGEGTYIYTVTGDATIDVSEDYIQGDFGVISIVGAVTHISFTINGDAYQAIEGMSWSAWFASSYNTTGETKGTITDSNGNEVSLDAVIVDGTAYEVGFAPPMATVGITGSNGYTIVSIDGVEYEPSVIEVPIGTEIICTVSDYGYGGSPYITLNGETVSTDTYTYIVVGNVTIERTDEYNSGGGGKDPYGVIHITEVPKGYVMLSVTGYGGDVSAEGISYSEGEIIVVPVGTVVTLNNEGWKYDETDSYIRVNGMTVLSGCGSYDYVATSNATITGSVTSTGNGTYYYCFDVTEE
jgi:hypothetical protein